MHLDKLWDHDCVGIRVSDNRRHARHWDSLKHLLLAPGAAKLQGMTSPYTSHHMDNDMDNDMT